MQSLASLMSMKQADIGNLDDFEEDNEEDEENRVNQEEKAAKITGWFCHKDGKRVCCCNCKLCSMEFIFMLYLCFALKQPKTKFKIIWANKNQ